MLKTKVLMAAVGASMLMGSFTANALCNGCVATGPIDVDLDDPRTTYSAVVKYRTWHSTGSGQTSQINYLTLTGSTMAYCQQQLSAVLNSPGVTVVQFCQAD